MEIRQVEFGLGSRSLTFTIIVDKLSNEVFKLSFDLTQKRLAGHFFILGWIDFSEFSVLGIQNCILQLEVSQVA
jgi:hypothetical protein